MAAEPRHHIPVLTEAIDRDQPLDGAAVPGLADRETLIAELQTQIASSAFALTEEVMRSAFAEMEASIFERITSRLRQELPEVIDQLLRERLAEETDY